MTAPARSATELNAEAEIETDESAKDADAFRTIGEAANELGLKPHVLRFWETKFDNLTPLKRADGRRYYRPGDMEVLRTLQNLLHVQGLTIRGAIRMIEEGGQQPAAQPAPANEAANEAEIDAADEPAAAQTSVQELQTQVREAVERGEFRSDSLQENAQSRERLEGLLVELTRLKSRVDEVRSVA